jgi:hypothetical protein
LSVLILPYFFTIPILSFDVVLKCGLQSINIPNSDGFQPYSQQTQKNACHIDTVEDDICQTSHIFVRKNDIA